MKIQFAVAFGIALLGSCIWNQSQPVHFVLPDGFEGSVVIVLNQTSGTPVDNANGAIIVDVPASGILKVSERVEQLSGAPVFRFSSGREVTYLYPTRALAPNGAKSFDDISPEQFSNEVFVMNYDEGIVNTRDGGIRYVTFTVCKPRDGNYFTSSDRSRKLAVAIGTMGN